MYLPTKIINHVTGEEITFDEAASTDTRLIWDEKKPPYVEPPPIHYHPDTEERFAVQEGLLVVEIDGKEHQLKAGEEMVVPPATPHVSYTVGEPARFRREVKPPGRWREALTARFAAIHAIGELSGVTALLQAVLLVRAYPDVVVPDQPPRPLQRLLFPFLAAIARITGLKPHYQYPRNDIGTSDQ